MKPMWFGNRISVEFDLAAVRVRIVTTRFSVATLGSGAIVTRRAAKNGNYVLKLVTLKLAKSFALEFFKLFHLLKGFKIK